MNCQPKWWPVINGNGEARVRAALVVREGVPHTIEIDRYYRTKEGALAAVKRIMARYGHVMKEGGE